jgi:hypothetical protein
VLAFYWKMLFLGRTIGGLDALDYFFPYRAYAANAIRQGRLPLWNPDIFGGVPFLANIQAAVLYPPSGLFYFLSEPVAYTWSVVLHTFLGGLFAYLFVRQSLRLSRAGALIAGIIFAFGGFMGGEMDHLNQLSAAVWLPALLLCWDKSLAGSPLCALLGALLVAMQFLAGHPQESYLMLAVLALYAAYRIATSGRDWFRGRLPRGLLGLACMLALGAGMAAAQLVPTSELTLWSIRANGLTYQQATAVSLKGTMLLNALLPPFWSPAWLQVPPSSEFLGYTGVTALMLSLTALAYGRRRQMWFFAGLAALGLFLALGVQNPLYPALFRLVPGFSVLRVPARWLFVYSFGVAILAGMGADALLAARAKLNWGRLAALTFIAAACGAWLSRIDELPALSTWLTWIGFGAAALALAGMVVWLSSFGLGRQAVTQGWQAEHIERRAARLATWRAGLVTGTAGLLALELWLAGQSLGYSQPVPDAVFSNTPPPLAFLSSAPDSPRVLSVAQDTFAPAIEPQLRQQYQGRLSSQELLDYLRDYKLREILEPDTTMAAGVATLDGYDGGLLPLARYALYKNLLTELPSAPDDRIRFVIKWPPNRALMDLAGVNYLLTDALHDKSVDGVGYDLSSFIHLDAQHPRATLTLARPHLATTIGMVVAAKPVVPLPSDRVVATLTVTDDDGHSESLPVPAGGADVGQLPFQGPLPARLAMAQLSAPMMVRSVTLSLQAGPTTDAFLNGLALIDPQGQAYSPLVAPGPEMTEVFKGDVKLYQNPAALPRAFLVHEVQLADSVEQAAAAMTASGFDPASQAIIEANPQPPAGTSLVARISRKVRQALGLAQPFSMPAAWLESSPPGGDQVAIQSQQPERIALTADSDQPGFLILTQSFYPGWQVTVDGAPAPLLAADALFQAVHLDAGAHQIEFAFRPRSVMLGEAISIAAALLWVGGLVFALLRRRG